MDLATIKPALLSWVATATGLEAVWRDDRRPWFPLDASTPGHALLHLFGARSVGVDETRWEHDGGAPSGEEITPSQVGSRIFTLSIFVQSLSHVPGEEAHHFLERARVRLRAPSSLEAFQAAGLAIVDSAQLLEIPTEIDDRVVSAAQLDVRFATLSTFDDTPTTYIERGVFSTDFSGADGASLPSTLQLENQEIPA